MDLASMAMAMWAKATIMFIFQQVAISHFTLRGIRVVLLKISKFDVWHAANLTMFLIHIAAIAVHLCQRQLSSGVNVTHKTQAIFLQVIQDLHLHLHRRK